MTNQETLEMISETMGITLEELIEYSMLLDGEIAIEDQQAFIEEVFAILDITYDSNSGTTYGSDTEVPSTTLISIIPNIVFSDLSPEIQQQLLDIILNTMSELYGVSPDDIFVSGADGSIVVTTTMVNINPDIIHSISVEQTRSIIKNNINVHPSLNMDTESMTMNRTIDTKTRKKRVFISESGEKISLTTLNNKTTLKIFSDNVNEGSVIHATEASVESLKTRTNNEIFSVKTDIPVITEPNAKFKTYTHQTSVNKIIPGIQLIYDDANFIYEN